MGLTYLRLLLLPVFLYLLLLDAGPEGLGYRHAALVVFGVMAVTDKLDGFLARRLGQQSRLGALLDPVADKLLISISLVLLSFRWCAPAGFAVPSWVVAVVYGKDALVVVGVFLLLRKFGTVAIRPRRAGKVSLALQMVLVLAVLAGPDLSSLFGGGAFGTRAAREAVVWLGRVTAGCTVAAAVDYALLYARLVRTPLSAGRVPPRTEP